MKLLPGYSALTQARSGDGRAVEERPERPFWRKSAHSSIRNTATEGTQHLRGPCPLTSRGALEVSTDELLGPEPLSSAGRVGRPAQAALGAPRLPDHLVRYPEDSVVEGAGQLDFPLRPEKPLRLGQMTEGL